MDSLSTQLAKARASIAWLSAKLDDASDAVKRADDSRERWQARESAEEKAKDGALKAQQEALARESAERLRADHYKELEEQAQQAVEVEGVEEAAARNATRTAEMWAMREKTALAVAETRLEEAHFNEERERDRMRSAEERANMSKSTAEAARAALASARGELQAKDAENERLQAQVAAAEREKGDAAAALREAEKAQDCMTIDSMVAR